MYEIFQYVKLSSFLSTSGYKTILFSTQIL